MELRGAAAVPARLRLAGRVPRRVGGRALGSRVLAGLPHRPAGGTRLRLSAIDACWVVAGSGQAGRPFGAFLHCPEPATLPVCSLQGFPRLVPSGDVGASAAATPQRQLREDQVVYELRAPGGASPALLGHHGPGGAGAALLPGAGAGGAGSAKRSLGGEALGAAGDPSEAELGTALRSFYLDPADPAGHQGDGSDGPDGGLEGAPGEGGAPAVFAGLGAAVGSLAGAGAASADADAGAGGGFTTAGLQHLAAKLRNGSVTPGGGPLQPAGGSGRYAGYEDSVESKQGAGPGAAPGSAAPASGGAASGSGRARVPALHLSRVSVADLLQGGGSDDPSPSGSGGVPGQLHAVSRQAQASISRLAQSMHSSGMAAVTPADIRAALAGAGPALADMLPAACVHTHSPAIACHIRSHTRRCASRAGQGQGAPGAVPYTAAGGEAGAQGAGAAATEARLAGVAQNLAAAGLFATPEVSTRPMAPAEGVDFPNLGSPAWPAGGQQPSTAAAAFNAALAAEVSAASLAMQQQEGQGQPPPPEWQDTADSAAAAAGTIGAPAAALAADVRALPLSLAADSQYAAAASAADSCALPAFAFDSAPPWQTGSPRALHLHQPAPPADPSGLLLPLLHAAVAAPLEPALAGNLPAACDAAPAWEATAAAADAAGLAAGTDATAGAGCAQAMTPAAAALAQLGNLYLNERTGQIMHK